MPRTPWEPPHEITAAEIRSHSDRLLNRADHPYEVRDDFFTISSLGMDWEVCGRVYAPQPADSVIRGADGKRIGIFLLHGGGGDHRNMETMGRLLAGKFGIKVATMTYPGHFNFLDPKGDWPGETIRPDGTARTPLWDRNHPITPDQYELVQDRSDPVLRAKYGTLFFLRAKEGTHFFDRLGAWPYAYEEAMKALCARNFPVGEYSIYLHGHSTGGPFVHMLLQRVANIAGLVGMESSPFGAIFSKMLNQGWPFPFNYITVRTWRDVARYAGPEAGPEGMRRLPWLMEDVLEEWEKRKHLPGMKAQHLVQFAAVDALEAAGRYTAARLGLGPAETEEMAQRFRGYPSPLSGPGTRPVPPLMYGLAEGSRDHTPERYKNILLPALSELDRAPKVRLVFFRGGVHNYVKPESDLPKGLGPAVAQLWHDAITGGYYLQA